jgi:serine phosphatase RsbU (regulator of sigma subunit)
VLTTEDRIEEALLPTRLIALSIALFTLMVGYGGIALLVARIISPFQRLTDWIRTAGHETVSDDVDIDTSNEVGEIAQAFSEMATKFRKAQIGLVQQKELQKEIQVAQEIQHMLLPLSFPQVEGYDLATHYESAKEVGGDLFDFVIVDDRTVGIVVADVSGKGVPGSLVMTMIRTALRLEARGNKNPGEVLAKVNDFVVDDMKKGMFVTMFYIILDSRNRRIHYASAGHNPMILHRCSTDQTYYLNPKGFPVGISLPDRTLFGKAIEIDTLRLQEDDILIAYTDGITEAMNPARDLFGEERFLESIRKHAHCSAREFVENMRQEILTFTQGAPQNDDITFVAIKDNMMAGDVIFNLRKNLFDAIASGVSTKDACKKAGVSTSTYYKWKKKFDEFGIEGLKVKEEDSTIELKHLSIQQRAKIMNIIRENPEAGPKVISDLLHSEAYGFTKIPEKRIYDELVRMRLNTAEKRKAFVTQRTRGRRQFKMPGTPLVTMDGQVIKSDSTATDSLVQQIIKQRQQPTEEQTQPQPSERTES